MRRALGSKRKACATTMTNEQLAEHVRSHILALRGEVNTRFEELNERLDRLEAKLQDKGGQEDNGSQQD